MLHSPYLDMYYIDVLRLYSTPKSMKDDENHTFIACLLLS